MANDYEKIVLMQLEQSNTRAMRIEVKIDLLNKSMAESNKNVALSEQRLDALERRGRKAGSRSWQLTMLCLSTVVGAAVGALTVAIGKRW